MRQFGLTLAGVLLIGAVVIYGTPPAAADLVQQIAELNQRIQDLERQRAEYEAQANAAGEQSKTLQSEVSRFNAQINQITAQIRSLEARIEQTDLEIGEAESGIDQAERQLALHQEALGKFIQAYSEFDDTNLAAILLRSDHLSDFFDEINTVLQTQSHLQGTIVSIRDLRVELQEQQEQLQIRQSELESIKGIHEIDQQTLAAKRREKDSLLQQTRGQEEQFQQLAQESASNIERLRDQIVSLRQSGITVEDAVQSAKLAAIGAGIRPAFLLALLEVESRLGQNVGTGNWQDDMVQCYVRLATIYYPNRRDHYMNRAETEKNAFLEITRKLGLDPDSVKVSREPTYGCGGAMGPAQFIPSTWLAYEAEVARLTGHNPPSPWTTRDAFTAAAVKLARGGATTRAGEEGAARAYVGGSTTCGIGNPTHICTSYSRTVLQKAAEIERNL